MAAVGTICCLAAIGLWKGAAWGTKLAVFILSANMIGNLLNALLRHDNRALIGLPIAGAMIWYLAVKARARKTFDRRESGSPVGTASSMSKAITFTNQTLDRWSLLKISDSAFSVSVFQKNVWL